MPDCAVEIFSAVPKTHNCAQSVAAGLGHEELVPVLAGAGGGRAPEGICGALYAALLTTPEAEHEEIRREFAARAGSVLCRELKTVYKFPCVECVRLAAGLAERHAGK